MAYTSSKQDLTMSALLVGMTHELEWIEAATELNAAYPKQFQGLIGNGEYHTRLTSNFHGSIGEIIVGQRVMAMSAEDESRAAELV